jgi:geranylgeranyl diphosphate synthase type I
LSEIGEILKNYTPAIETYIKNTLADAPEFLGGVVRYHFGWVDQNFQPARTESGKMLRPVICLLVFDALTGSYKNAMPAAAAIEMIHNFTLLHDDIEDNDRERRGRPTAWTVWGKPLAINAGDYLYTLAFQTLFKLDGFPAERIFAVQRLIADSCLVLTMGQDLDLRFEQSQTVTPAMYIDMVYKKTGALLEASVLAGALLATDDVHIIAGYRQFARNIGIAFQIQDDILGIWGDSAKTGKSTDNDLRRKKKTLPVLYTIEQATGSRLDQLRALYASDQPLTDEQINFVRDSLARVNARDYAQQAADSYIEKAFAGLNDINVATEPQQNLEKIARFLIDRSH